MLTTRRRRIARRAVMALAAVVVLLPFGYAGSVATLIFLLNARIVPLTAATRPQVEAYTSPFWWYMESEWPGAKACDDMIALSKKTGQRIGGR